MNYMIKAKIIILCAVILMPVTNWAADFYVDPVNGSMENDGSYENPWSTIQEVFENDLIEMKVYAVTPYEDVDAPKKLKNPGAPVKSGDTMYLRSGYHGEIWERGAYNDEFITITAEDGHTPVLKRIFLSAASKWHLKGLTVTPSAAPEYERVTLITAESHGWHGPSSEFIIENCSLYSVEDISSWTADDWNSLACSGIRMYAPDSIIRNNNLHNVNFGMVIGRDRILVEKNKIINLSGDGIVGGADFLTFQYNTIKNFFKVNENHDDGIQFHRGTNTDRIPMKNIILRGNIIVDNDDTQNNPLIGSPQGIGCFDNGMYENWVVENNVVVVNHWHGISVYGAINCRIVNNTVLNVHGDRATWISLGNNPRDTVVRNNFAVHTFNYEGENITSDHNISLRDLEPEDYFNDFQNLDFRLKEGSPALDAGSSDLAPAVDIRGVQRPKGISYDIGAYEYNPDGDEVGFPIAFFFAVPNDREVSLNVEFDATGSSDPDGQLVDYAWDFGDGTEGSGVNITHEYSVSGEYQVKLMVTDNDGKTAEYEQNVRVTDRINVFADVPVEQTALKCFGNVFNPLKNQQVLIRIELPERMHVEVIIYDNRGNKIKGFLNEELPPGGNNYYWNGRDGSGNIVGSGIYFVHMECGGYKKTKKIAVIK